MLRHVILVAGTKGGIGKTLIMSSLSDYLKARGLPLVLLDCDVGNKVKGSLASFFPDEAKKIDVRKPDGLDCFIDEACVDGSPIVLADFGASGGLDLISWLGTMYTATIRYEIAYTIIGVVDANPGSLEGLFAFAEALQDKDFKYIVVRNLHIGDVPLWDNGVVAGKFRERFSPAVITVRPRLQSMQTHLENHALTLTAALASDDPLFKRISARVRIEMMRDEIFAEFDKVIPGLLDGGVHE